MKATVTTKRAFLVDLERGDIVKVRSRCYVVNDIKIDPEQETVKLYAGLVGGALPVLEAPWYTPMTVYIRKEVTS